MFLFQGGEQEGGKQPGGGYFMGGGASQYFPGGMPGQQQGMQGMPGGGPIPTLQGPPQTMFQQVRSEVTSKAYKNYQT